MSPRQLSLVEKLPQPGLVTRMRDVRGLDQPLQRIRENRQLQAHRPPSAPTGYRDTSHSSEPAVRPPVADGGPIDSTWDLGLPCALASPAPDGVGP
jgi:hypothetical protein